MTVADLIDDNVRVNAAARAAIIAFKRSKPWRGTFAERWEKIQSLQRGLADAYGITPGMDFIDGDRRSLSPNGMDPSVDDLAAIVETAHGNGAFDARKNRIVLFGKLSIVTFLHTLCRARGKTRKEAFRWSLSVFKRFFPISFSRCRAVGPYLVRN